MISSQPQNALENHRVTCAERLATSSCRLASQLRRDVPANGVSDDDYVLINSRARVENKAQLIADYIAPDFRLNPFTVKHPVTKVWGNAAILSGVARLTGMSGGKPYDVTLHFADVWRRSQGRRQGVFTEVTAVPNRARIYGCMQTRECCSEPRFNAQVQRLLPLPCYNRGMDPKPLERDRLNNLARDIIKRVRGEPWASTIVLGGDFALAHYLKNNYRKTNDLDAWWSQETSESQIEIVSQRLRDVMDAVASDNDLTFHERTSRGMLSLELQEDGETVFSLNRTAHMGNSTTARESIPSGQD